MYDPFDFAQGHTELAECMRKVFLFAVPLLLSTGIFLGVLFFLERQSSKGGLQVTSIPKSKVYLDNKLIGETPFCACKPPQMFQTGDYSIRVVPTEDSFKTFEEKITINKSIITVVDRTFAKSGSSGSVVSLSKLSDEKDIEILVESIPTKANIFLDNNPVGTTTLLLKNTSEGGHDIRVTKDGFKEKLIKVNTKSGYRIISKLFLGVSDLVNDIATSSGTASSSAITVKHVLILDTPTGFLRVRADGSLSSLEVGRVKPGEKYEVLDEKDGWIEIQFEDDKKGWISAQYAKKE